MKRRYFIAGYTWDKESQKERFLREGIWENGYDNRYQDVYDNIRVGDYIALKSTFVQGRKSVLRIHKIGIIKAVSKDSMLVNVDWIENGAPKDITNITWYANTLCEITNINHIYMIFNMNKSTELIEDYSTILKSNWNLIFTGAPGTGKTFLAKQLAQQMILGNVKEHLTEEEQKQFNEQCGFVQFHPSYDYTDFVEGLRPKRDDDGNVGFERKNGVFKDFCKKALQHSTNQRGLNVTEKHFDESWQKLLDHVRENIAKGELTKIGIWEYGLSSTDSLKYTSLDTPSKYTFTINKKNVFDAYRGLKARPSGYFQKYIEDVVKYMIENFGLQPYKKTQDSMKDQGNRPFVFIIDEINRGEISKVFGELFFSIDPGYRGEKGKVNTQYQNLIEDDDEFYDGFFVPENVYILGTMNDIDRSVESMDFAMRRRFAFKEIKVEDRIDMLDDLQWKEDAIERMKKLNTAIEEIEGLSSAYHIGPAYFLKLKNYNGDFDQLWEYHIEGLLFEYLRGMVDVNIKLKALANAYGYSKANNHDLPSNN